MSKRGVCWALSTMYSQKNLEYFMGVALLSGAAILVVVAACCGGTLLGAALVVGVLGVLKSL